MSSSRSYNIIGTGAIGGYYGACLQKQGINVNFLLNSDYEYVKQHGLVIESIQGDFELPSVNAFNKIENMPIADVVIVALKTTDNYLLSEQLLPLVQENTTVLVLQNGLGSEADIAEIVGSDKVIRGIPWIFVNKISSGHICHINHGKIILGQYTPNYEPKNPNEKMHQIQKDFESSGIQIKLTNNLLEQILQKSYFHIPHQSLSIILNSSPKIFLQDPDIKKLVGNIQSEIISIASAYDCQLKTKIKEIISSKYPIEQKHSFIPSMRQDYQNKKSLEIETVLGNPIKMAQKLGIKTPYLTTIYQQIKFINAQNIK